MKKHMWSSVALALAFVLGAITAGQILRPAMAQETGQGRIAFTIVSGDAKLKDVPIMVSVVKDGEVVWQHEFKVGWNATDNLPSGLYDVRFEGDGVKTLVKRGVRITGAQVSIVAPLTAGQGVRIVEYATGGLSREEVAARLQKLEAAVAELQKASRK